MAVVLVASLMASIPSPASADPIVPAGATSTPPVQRSAAVTLDPRASTEATQGRRGPGVPAKDVKSRHPVPRFMERLEDRRLTPKQAAVEADRSWAAEFASRFGGVTEVVSARTPFSTEFANPDGSSTLRVFDEVAFVDDGRGALRPVDTSLVSVAGRFVPFAAAAKVSFAGTAADAQLASWQLGAGVSVGFGLSNAAAKPAVVDGDVARYVGVATDADLELAATPDGIKETLVLRSAAAPSSWVFPLRTAGLTPTLDAASGSVLFSDRHGRVWAAIPPGFMEDSAIDPIRGGYRSSNGVRYSLIRQGAGWALRVDLDAAWLGSASRVWPVRVDPSVQNFAAETDDTFVSSHDYPSQNNSARSEMLVGTYNGGTEKSVSFLHFSAAIAALAGKTITGTNLKAYNTWSYSCTPKPVSVHKVTAPWTGSTTTTYAGPAFEATALATSTFAYGYSSCPIGGWGSWALPVSRVQAWVNNTETFYGLTLRASLTDSTGWKRFTSMNGTAGRRPYLEVSYDNAPGISALSSPLANSVVDSLVPTLWADLVDPAGTGTRQYEFEVCGGTAEAPTGCQNSGPTPLTTSTWPVPAGTLSWGKDFFWRANVSNGLSWSGWTQPIWFRPMVPQPPVTSHLAAAPEGADLPGLNPQVGNYSTTVTDATMAVAGPALAVTRTYNSQDLRTTGAFGAGWSTPLNQRLVWDQDGSGNLVATLASGRQVRFGQNPGTNTYTSPEGETLTMVYNTGIWTLRDSSGYQRLFDGNGRLLWVIDPDGREQAYDYDANQHITTVTDTTSGRALHLTWTGNHVMTIALDPPGAGIAAPAWTYTYTGETLTQVCTPLGVTSCVSYGYVTSSHYRSVVLDAAPVAYWPLGESSGPTAVNVAARTAGQFDATYSNVTLGATGALAGSPDTAATFTSASSSKVTLPVGLTWASVSLAIEVWFKAAAGGNGVLFAQQSVAPPAAPATGWTPNLYIGTDGKLRGQFPTATGLVTPITTLGTVTNGQWHHAVLTASVNTQELFLDGASVGTMNGLISHGAMAYTTVGNGYTYLWPAGTAGFMPFSGQIDDVAIYTRPLSGGEAAAHYAAQVATTRLATVVEPGPFTAITLTYQHATGRVATVADRNGATWTLAAPTLAGDQRTVSLSSTARPHPISYTYDTSHNGRPATRTDFYGTRTWGYNADTGFVSSVTDENGNTTSYATDARGNVTSRTTSRDASTTSTEYFGYYLDPENPLDPRNDQQIWSADARSTNADDLTYRTTRTLDTSGRVTQITYPKPAGQAANPTEQFTYSTAPGGAYGYTTATAQRGFVAANTTVLPLTGDDGVTQVSLPFAFPFFGTNRTSLWVNIDGYAAFTNQTTWPASLSTAPPTAAEPNNVVMPMLADFIVDANASVRTTTAGTSPNRTFIVEWRNVYLYGQPDIRVSFEVLLIENGSKVEYRYAGIDPGLDPEAGSTATVGLENAAGSTAVVYSHHQPLLTDDLTLTYTPSGATYTQAVTPGTYTPANTTVLPATGDEDLVAVELPFPVPLYGQAQNTLWVSSNGFAAFTNPQAPWINPPGDTIPNPALPNNTLMAFADDLNLDGLVVDGSLRTATVGTAPNRQFIVEWRCAHTFQVDTQRLSVELVLSENGTIIYRYAGIDADPREQGNEAVIGVENYDGTAAVQYASHQTQLAAVNQVTFTPTQPQIPAGLLLSATARNGAVTTQTYNAAGDTLTVTDPVGLVTTSSYDRLGRAIVVNRSSSSGGSYVSFGSTSYTYNGLSQPLTVTGPGINNPVADVTHTAVTTNTYDGMGRHTRQDLSDATGGDATRTTTWHYDTAGRLDSTTAADNAVTAQTWNTAGDIATITKPGALVLTYGFDEAHRLTTTTATGSQVDPQNSSATSVALEARAYDPAGRLATVTDAMGRATTYSYYWDNLLHTTTAERTAPDPDIVLVDNTYDPAGHATTVTRAGGRTTTYTFDPAGYVSTQALDPTGLNRVTSTVYNKDGSVQYSTATGAASPGRTERVDYTYDLAGRVLTTAVDNTGGSPAILTTTLIRDPRGLVTRETDPSGVVADHTYDLAGQPLSTTGAARTIWVNGAQTADVAPITTIGRNTFGDPTHLRDPNSQTTTTGFDPMGRATSVTLPAYTPPGGSLNTSTTSTVYNLQGLPQTRTDGTGAVTSFTYDKYGRTLTMTEPDPDGAGPKTGPQWTYAYDRNGELLDITDPAGAHTSSTWDEMGRQFTSTTSERVGGSTFYYTTTFGHNDAGDLITTRTPLNNTTTVTYNAAGEPTRSTDPTGRFTETAYDLAGRSVSTVVGQNSTYVDPVTTTSFDLAGRAVSTSDYAAGAGGAPSGAALRTATTAYDGAGRVTQHTTAEGRPTYQTYDAAGQLATVTQRVTPATPATAITVSLGYDRNGNQTRTLDGNANATITTYTPWNLVETVVEPSTTAHPNTTDRTWTAIYDPAGRSVEERLPGSVTRTRTYDQLGRLTAETGTGATTTARSLDYDPLGRVTAATSPAGNHTYTWSDRGLLGSATGYGGTATYLYTAEGRLEQRVDAAGTATFGYDTAGRTISVVDPLTATTATNGYDAAGRLSTVSHGAGKSTRAYTYDNLGRLFTDTTRNPAAATTATIQYGYDKDGLLTTKTTTGLAGAGANTYTYDGLGRVFTWLNPGGATTTYGYDAASNRTTATTPAGTRTSTFDQRNRLTGTTGAAQPADTYTWTPRGTLATTTTDSVTTTYTFDAFERLTQAAKAGAYTVTFTYDSLDRPAQRGSATFGYHDLTNAPVLSPTALGEATLLREPDGNPLSTKTGAGAARYVLDNGVHHDVVATTDPGTGVPDASADYDPYGTTTSSTGTLPLGYQGGWTDYQTAQVNAHARWYSPGTGSFTSRDTLTQAPNPITQTNRYLYANGSPLTKLDPDGHRAAMDDAHGNAVVDRAAPRARYVAPVTRMSANKARYNCGDSAGCRDAPAETIIVVPPPKRHLDTIVREVTKPLWMQVGDGILDAAQSLTVQPFIDLYNWGKGGLEQATNDGEAVGRGDMSWWDALKRGFDYVVMPSINSSIIGPNALINTAIGTVQLAIDTYTSAANGDAQTATKDSILLAATLIGIGRLFRGGGATSAAAGDSAAAGESGAATTAGRSALLRGSASALCSFAAATLVLLADGTTKPIAAVAPGDRVLTTDPATGTNTPQAVTATWAHDDLLLDLRVGLDRITTTEDHPYWNATDKAWEQAQQFDLGDQLHTADGRTAPALGLDWTTAHSAPAYSLTVANTHTYYVLAGTTPVLVHNAPISCTRLSMHGPTNPGPLTDTVASTFRSSTYWEVELAQPTTLYRVYGNNASQLGRPQESYWTTTRPRGPMQSAVDSALNPAFGNSALQWVEIKVPAGTRMYLGTAAEDRLIGGGPQVVIVQPVPPEWIVGGGTFG